MMKNRRYAHLPAALALVGLSGPALVSAAPFISMDPRSLGMGGTGVASGNSANASFVNPALLATADRDRFSLELPILGVRVADPDDLEDAVNNFDSDDYVDAFAKAINAFNDVPPSDRAIQLRADLITVSRDLIGGLNSISNKVAQGEAIAATVVGIPSERFGIALQISAWGGGSGFATFSDEDQQVIEAIITQLENNNDANIDDNTVGALTSAAQARFAVFAEVGVSISRQFDLAGQQWALGITPKYVEVLTYDYFYLGKDIDTAEFSIEEGEKRYSSFNVDIGAARELGDGWQFGAVVKNLIPQEYETIRNNTITLDPQLRIGAAHRSDGTTVAIDLDITENDPIAFGPATQYLGAGVEFNLWKMLQLRAGYRHNLSDSDTSVATAGIGLSPFGMHIDLAAAANSDEITGSLQLGVRF